MKNHWAVIILALLIIIILLSACSAGTNPTTTTSPSSTTSLDGATLVQERCSRCHPLNRVESAKHTATEWKTIVDTMISRGAQLSPDEETIVVDWLTANYGQ